MPIFTVGVDVVREQSTAVIVRVEADTEDAARGIARDAVREKCRLLHRAEGLFASDPHWEEDHFYVDGDSQGDFHDGYSPDLDLTAKAAKR